MFWMGFGVGLLIGAAAGAVGLALLAIKADRHRAR